MRTIQTFISDLSSTLHQSYDEGEVKAIAQYLLTDVLALTQTDFLLLSKDTALSPDSEHRLYEALHRLGQGEPLQYVLGYTYFLNCKLITAPGVLIPRPETEELLYIIKEAYNIRKESSTNRLRILDIGTGSACIPVGLAYLLGDKVVRQIDAVEMSADAIIIAKQNASLATSSTHIPIDIIEANLFELPHLESDAEAYDIIVSNPPYIHPDEAQAMTDQVLSWEPHIALFTPRDRPTLYYDAIAMLVNKGYLRAGGDIYVEINPLYAEETLASMSAIIGQERLAESRIIRDMSNKSRFIHLRIY